MVGEGERALPGIASLPLVLAPFRRQDLSIDESANQTGRVTPHGGGPGPAGAEAVQVLDLGEQPRTARSSPDGELGRATRAREALRSADLRQER